MDYTSLTRCHCGVEAADTPYNTLQHPTTTVPTNTGEVCVQPWACHNSLTMFINA